MKLAEMLGLDSPGDDKDEICAKIPAVLATDSKNTYDNMGKVAAFLNSKEKLVGIDLSKLQECCENTELNLRRVNGDAQLANSLTKPREPAQINMFYRMGGRWRLVYDDRYVSARKRKQLGKDPLEDGNIAEKTEDRQESSADKDGSEGSA